MIVFKIIVLFLLLPVFFGEAVIKGAAHFISLVAVMFYAAFKHEDGFYNGSSIRRGV